MKHNCFTCGNVDCPRYGLLAVPCGRWKEGCATGDSAALADMFWYCTSCATMGAVTVNNGDVLCSKCHLVIASFDTSALPSPVDSAALAVEFGYRGCERGWNIQRTLEEYRKASIPSHTVVATMPVFPPDTP